MKKVMKMAKQRTEEITKFGDIEEEEEEEEQSAIAKIENQGSQQDSSMGEGSHEGR